MSGARNVERRLIGAADFRALALKGASADDLAHLAVFKAAGRMDVADAAARTVDFVLSTATQDREGDSIEVKGWEWEDYVRNGVVLFAHLANELPVAKSLKIWSTADALMSRDQFPEKDLYEFGDTVYRMVIGGFLSAVSVGFQPKAWEPMTSSEGLHFTRQTLLEHSVVPVPAHPDALVVARSKGIDTAPLKKWAEEMLDLMTVTKAAPDVRSQVERLRAQADPAGRRLVLALSELRMPKSLDLRDDPPVHVLELDAEPGTGRAGVSTPVARAAAPAPAVPDPAAAPPPPPAEAPTRPCPGCDGAGAVACRSCLGTGVKAMVGGDPAGGGTLVPEQPGEPQVPPGACAVCKGAKMVTCEKCMGSGAVPLKAEGGPETKAGVEIADAGAAAAVESAEGHAAVVLGVGDVAHPRRWNAALSKAFDITRERFEARSVEQELAARYADCDVKELEQSQFTVSTARMGSFLSALDTVLEASCKVDDIRNLSRDGQEMPPVYEKIQLNSSSAADFLVDGLRFVQAFGVKFCLRLTPEWWGLEVTTYVERAERAAAETIKSDVARRQAELTFLKGEAFALSGEFLTRGAETWDDLFLSPKNERAARRIAALIEAKGADLENRGALLVGPPGTGKTLFGRILLNTAKATFIWVSARDFRHSGAFGGLTYAFDLAKENAPTVLFIEDVDNWMDGYTVDMMKTEMDGIAQSKGVVTILTTNYPELLPAALIDRPGRFHDVLRFDLPDEAARVKMLARWLPDLGEAERAAAAAATQGYSGAHVREFARFALIIAEQDGLALKDAIGHALAKLKEQRDLITSVQSAGSRYRAPRDVETRSAGTASMELVLKGADLAEIVRGELGRFKAVEQTTRVGAVSSMVRVERAGRILANRNEQRIRTAQSHVVTGIDTLGDTEGAHLQKAVGLLQDVIAEIEPDEDDDPAAQPGGGDAPAPTLVAAAPAAAAKHVLVLDEERPALTELGPVDEAAIKAAIARTVADVILRKTGRVVDV